MTTTILCGDVRELLRTLPDRSVHCGVTSPPYWGLRSYLPKNHPDKHKEIGQEPSVYAWIDTMVGVLGEFRRVLRNDGTLWLNVGDSYAGSRRGGSTGQSALITGSGKNESMAFHGPQMTASRRRDDHEIPRSDVRIEGIKDKDLIGQPWMLAFALRQDGWWLRQAIIWHKLNAMPESTRDRCVTSHEYVFLLSKSKRYYFDYEAIMEPGSEDTHARYARGRSSEHKYADGGPGDQTIAKGFGHMLEKVPSGWDTGAGGHREQLGRYGPATPKAQLGDARTKNKGSFDAALREVLPMRRKRSVWTMANEPFKGAHFATFPTALARPCILAGCPVGGIVIDPFGGSGTTALEADRLGRHSIVIDLDARNVPMTKKRLRDECVDREVEVAVDGGEPERWGQTALALG